MTAREPTPRRSESSRRRRWSWLVPIGLILAIPIGISWYLTAPLSDESSPTTDPRMVVLMPDSAAASTVEEPVEWPAGTLDGEPAKRILLASTRQSVARLERVACYTATFRREERVGGVLGPEIVSRLKIRNHPFAIYLKYLAPKGGKEVVYAEGHRDNKVLAHNGDWTRRFIPRLAVAPDSALALADSRHPVTEAGLLNLSRKLLRFRELDMGDADATTRLDRASTVEGRPCLRSVHSHSNPNDGRPFCLVEILYDPETQVPFQIKGYDWPGVGHTGPPDLAERYTYDDLKLDAPLTTLDFDPNNPDYAFMRF